MSGDDEALGQSPLALLEAHLPPVEATLQRFAQDPIQIAVSPMQDTAAFLRELGLARGEAAPIARAIALRRRLIAGAGLEHRRQTDARLDLVGDLHAQASLLGPEAQAAARREAVDLIRAALERAGWTADKDLELRARIALAWALLELRRSDPTVDISGVGELMLAGERYGEESADRLTWGTFGLAHVAVAAQEGRGEVARARIERAIRRAKGMLEWGTLPLLRELERQLGR